MSCVICHDSSVTWRMNNTFQWAVHIRIHFWLFIGMSHVMREPMNELAHSFWHEASKMQDILLISLCISPSKLLWVYHLKVVFSVTAKPLSFLLQNSREYTIWRWFFWLLPNCVFFKWWWCHKPLNGMMWLEFFFSYLTLLYLCSRRNFTGS
jgi:hypothetical protein